MFKYNKMEISCCYNYIVMIYIIGLDDSQQD
jgi:hypothetical protein